MYEKIVYAGWGDMDFNSHMRNTAFLDKSGDVRMLFFTENGFSPKEWAIRRIGPVIMKDELEYYREINLLDEVKVTLSLMGVSPDGSRFSIRNDFYLPNGKLAARVSSIGGWMDLNTRKLIHAPLDLQNIILKLEKTHDFTNLPSSLNE